jgi:hypothetical protein
LFAPPSPLLLCVFACCMFSLFMPTSSSSPCSLACYLFALFVLTPPSSHCVRASTCLLPICLVTFVLSSLHRVLASCLFALISPLLPTCLLLVRLVHIFSTITMLCVCFCLLVTCLPCSCLLHHHYLFDYYLSTLFVPTLPLLVFGHHALSTKPLFCHHYLMCLLSLVKLALLVIHLSDISLTSKFL